MRHKKYLVKLYRIRHYKDGDIGEWYCDKCGFIFQCGTGKEKIYCRGWTNDI